MPYIVPSMTGLVSVKGSSVLLTGQKFIPFVNATSRALCQYLTMVPISNSTNMVLGPGAGTFTGRIVGCSSMLMSNLMMTGASIKMLRGKDMKRFFDAVSFGVCTTLLTTGMVQGSVVGGGPGVGRGKILNMQPIVMQGLIITNLIGNTFVGSKIKELAYAIAFGCCMHIMTTATVINTCIGTFTPPPIGPIMIPTAPGIGRLI